MLSTSRRLERPKAFPFTYTVSFMACCLNSNIPGILLFLLPRSSRLDAHTSASALTDTLALLLQVSVQLPSQGQILGPGVLPQGVLERTVLEEMSLIVGVVLQGHNSNCYIFILLNRRAFSLSLWPVLSLGWKIWSVLSSLKLWSKVSMVNISD